MFVSKLPACLNFWLVALLTWPWGSTTLCCSDEILLLLLWSCCLLKCCFATSFGLNFGGLLFMLEFCERFLWREVSLSEVLLWEVLLWEDLSWAISLWSVAEFWVFKLSNFRMYRVSLFCVSFRSCKNNTTHTHSQVLVNPGDWIRQITSCSTLNLKIC